MTLRLGKRILFVFVVQALSGCSALSDDALDSQSAAPDSTPVSEPLPTEEELLKAAAGLHPFDLETRGILAMNAISRAVDPAQKVPYVFAWFESPLRYEGPAAVLNGESLDGLSMARLINGKSFGIPMEQALRKSLFENATEGLVWYGEGTELAGQKHLLTGVLTLHRLYPDDPRPLEVVRQSLQTLYDIARRGTWQEQPYLYYPVPEVEPGPGGWSFIGYYRDGWRDRTLEPLDTGSAGFQGALTLPIAQYYELTADPLAKDYLDQFIRFLLKRATDFNPDGSFTKTDVVNGQVWSRMMTIQGILIYGLTSGQSDLTNWAQKAFDRTRQLHGTRFGWIPENLAFNHGQGCETDTMTAQIETAFLLARKVDDAYWEVAERIAMNQLMAQQLLRVDILPGEPMGLLGGFASFCSPHDWWTRLGPYITQSAHGSGMRAFYNVWYHTAWWEQGGQPGEPGRTLRVNLHWSKNLPGAQIISHLPAATTLEVHLQRPSHLIVRKPDWAKMKQIQVKATSSSGGPSTPAVVTQHDRWLHLGHFDANTRVVLDFPNEVVTHQDLIHNRAAGETYSYTTRWRGNAVLSIEPNGVKQPNYAGRQRPGLKPYIPSYTPLFALDPIAMTPLERTGELRSKRTVGKRP